MTTTYTPRELGEALGRVHDNPIPPVVRRYDRLHKLFQKELDLDPDQVTGIAYDEVAKIKMLAVGSEPDVYSEEVER